MPFDDADEDDPAVGGQPLPPDDRLWRHPSELGAIERGQDEHPRPVLDQASPSATRTWAVAVVAALIGSALSLGAVAAAGRLSDDVVEKPVTERVAVRPSAEVSLSGSSGASVLAISKSVAPSITHLAGTRGTDEVAGSAIVIRDDGYLVTNGHLVAGLRDLQIVFADGTTVPGRVVGSDAMTDVAVVKVDREHLQTALLGTATDLEAGQTTIAIASPLGPSAGPSVSVTLIDALGRRTNGRDGTELHDLIQTDAPIAADGSGGALCDASGSVIGMTTDVADDESTNGLGFAIPVDIVRAIADDLISSGVARHPWLGIEGGDLDATDAKAMGLSGGAKVTKVADNSPASAAGVKADDVITALNGSKVTSMSSFVVALRGHHPGDAVSIDVLRDGSEQPVTMTITLAEKNHS